MRQETGCRQRVGSERQAVFAWELAATATSRVQGGCCRGQGSQQWVLSAADVGQALGERSADVAD
jgi:hypothetical protein